MKIKTCKHCGQLTFFGYTDEHKAPFCSIDCYKWFCVQHMQTRKFSLRGLKLTD